MTRSFYLQCSCITLLRGSTGTKFASTCSAQARCAPLWEAIFYVTFACPSPSSGRSTLRLVGRGESLILNAMLVAGPESHGWFLSEQNHSAVSHYTGPWTGSLPFQVLRKLIRHFSLLGSPISLESPTRQEVQAQLVGQKALEEMSSTTTSPAELVNMSRLYQIKAYRQNTRSKKLIRPVQCSRARMSVCSAGRPLLRALLV